MPATRACGRMFSRDRRRRNKSPGHGRPSRPPFLIGIEGVTETGSFETLTAYQTSPTRLIHHSARSARAGLATG